MEVLFREWPNVLTLLARLIVIITLIITALGPRVGLALQGSVIIGFLLSRGGEFAFVVFSRQQDKTAKEYEAEMYANIKEEAGETCRINQTTSTSSEPSQDGKNGKEDEEKQGMEEIATENEAKKRRIV